jgi:hypothetical protein
MDWRYFELGSWSTKQIGQPGRLGSPGRRARETDRIGRIREVDRCVLCSLGTVALMGRPVRREPDERLGGAGWWIPSDGGGRCWRRFHLR